MDTDMDIAGRRPCGDESRDENSVSTSQGMPRVVGNHQKLKRRMGTDSIYPQSLQKEPAIPTPWFGLRASRTVPE